MDVKKMNIPTLDGPNWGEFSIHLQAATCILDCWVVIQGEVLGTNAQTYDLLVRPTPPGAQATATDIAAFSTAKCRPQCCQSYGKTSFNMELQKTCGMP